MKANIYRSLCCFALLFSFYMLLPQRAAAYSVLTHQAVIDAAWHKSLQPLLLQRFPGATEEELRSARAHAYGGSIIQDMGYFPFGNAFFTDLVHYVRTGDFVENLIASSQTLDELAFALGALAHYKSDIYGHPIGTNRAVSLVYPKVKAEFGDTVTYAEHPLSHIKIEFGFDVLQVARGNYAPEDYKDFIGFKVAPEVLEKAFLSTYGLELKDVFVSLPLAVNSYRYTIKNLMPELTKAAWHAKKGDIKATQEGVTRRKFVYRMRNARYHEQWGNNYDKPNIFTRLTAWVIRGLPKVGPLRPLALVPPTPEAEKYFMESFNTTVDNYSLVLDQLKKRKRLSLQNPQLDTGEQVVRGKYTLADETYAKLLSKLSANDFKHITPELRIKLLSFYDGSTAPAKPEQEAGEWEETAKALAKLNAMHL